jgi:uncharacterized delta-60 repeat protein
MKKLLLLIGLALSLTINAQLATDVEHSFGAFNGAGFNGAVNTITMQIDANDDGEVDLNQKFVVGGSFTSYNMQTVNRLIRFNSDCSFDNAFNTGSGFDNSVITVALETNGKILVGGDFTSYNGIPANKIVRLNSDGTIDTSFSIGTGFNNSVKKIIVQPDGKILVGGYFTSYNSTTQNAIVRLNADGSVDGSFVSTLASGSQTNDIALQSDGKILAGGGFLTGGGFLSRLNITGTKDISFSNFLYGCPGDKIHKIAIQQNGTIWVGGSFINLRNNGNENINTGLIKITLDGSIVPVTFFIRPGTVSMNCVSYRNVSLLSIEPDGKIYISARESVATPNPFGGGLWFSNRTMFGRFNSDGSSDFSYSNLTGNGQGDSLSAQEGGTINSVSLQQDGKILVGGNYITYNNNTNHANLLRLYGSTALSTTQFSNTSLKLYPNPTQSILNIQTFNSALLDKITISDLTGKIVIEQTQNTNQVSVEKLASGVYILNGYSEGNKFQEKFVKE